MSNRQKRLKAEIAWHGGRVPRGSAALATVRQILNSRLFFDVKRHKYAYSLTNDCLKVVLRERTKDGDLILVCPSGHGRDYDVIPHTVHTFGVDIAESAVKDSSRNYPQVAHSAGDALSLPYVSDVFDIILCNLFLHHVVDDGWKPYLNEFRRVLKPGGYLIVQEPSVFYPISWVTWPLRMLLRAVFRSEVVGHVPHEHPINTSELARTMVNAGFLQVESQGSSWVHNRLYLPVARAVARYQHVLSHVPFIKHTAWMVILVARKAR